MAGSKTTTRRKKTTDALPHIPEPWDRIPEEGAKAFAAFVKYRDLPAHERSIGHSVGKPGPDATSAVLRLYESRKRQAETWSAAHFWTARSIQYDEHRDRIRRAAEAHAVEEMGRRHAEAAMELVRTGVAALALVKPEELPFSDLLRFVTEGARLERLARGEPESTAEIAGVAPQDDIRRLLSSDPDTAKAAAMLAASVSRARRREATS